MSCRIRFTFLVAVLLVSACSKPPAGAPSPGGSVTLMAFNVENLFDTVDDPDKDDRDYLPLTAKQTEAHREACAGLRFESWQRRCLTLDWNEDLVEKKLDAVAQAILQGGNGPDVIAFQEIENIGILERLRTGYLADRGYLPAILVEGNDSRGIDVAFLSRLPLMGQPVLHDIQFSGEFADAMGDTRGILQADFRLPDDSILTGFAVHFPAPYHPTGMRVAAYETLNGLLAELPGDRHVFAAGDFNTTSEEDAREGLLDRHARPHWVVSNDHCDGCRGTSYYPPDDSWSFLDMILWRPCCGENATWRLRADGVEIANGVASQRRRDGTPRRFSVEDGSGVSDHWPVVLTIESAAIQ